MSAVPTIDVATVPSYDDRGVLQSLTTLDPKGQPMSVTDYYEDGSTRASYEVANGFWDGEFISFHPNGEVDEYGFYVMGRKDGRFTKNHPNGKLLSEQYYLKGKLHGRSSYFDGETGQLTLRMHFKNDLLDGLYESFYKDGSREMSVRYDAGNSDDTPIIRKSKSRLHLAPLFGAKNIFDIFPNK